MINPLQVATDGYLTASDVTKKVLILALAGYLTFAGAVVPPPTGGGGSSGSSYNYSYNLPQKSSLQEQIEREDEEILVILKMISVCL